MYENQNYYNPYAQNIAIVKEYLKKPIVLTIGILYIVSIVFSLITAVSMGSSFGNFFDSIFTLSSELYEYTAEEQQVMSLFTNSGFFSTMMICAMIPSIIMTGLFVLAYFLMYFKSKNPNPDVSPKGGATILFVMSIISLVGTIIASLVLVLYAVIFVIFGIVAAADPSIAGDGGVVLLIVFIIFALLMLGIAAITLVYSISNMNFYNSIRKSLSSVTLTHKGAGVYGVFSIIYGGMSVFSAISTMFYGPLMKFMTSMVPQEEMVGFPTEIFDSLGSMYTLSGLAALVSSVMMILCGIFALGYKKHINRYINTYAGEQMPEQPMTAPAYNQPSYSQPQYTQPEYTQPTYSEPQYTQPQYTQPDYTNDYQQNAPDSDQTTLLYSCPRCGSACKDADVFCNICGYKIK